MVFKCKICGGELNISQGESITVCEYCGVKQTIPVFSDPKISGMFEQTNHYLLHNEFDKAENILNQILLIDKSNAEVYWNLLLCKYGVSYVEDPKTSKYMPTCNRTQYGSIFKDENYINAISYANIDKKSVYESDAQTIDAIQKGILAISQKEKPFDIFISYKETDNNNQRTKDSIVAQELYEKLTKEGYKVFFSRITLEDKLGSEYEPYIYAALASSKIMLTISSSKENIDAVWVKNEWSRFLTFMKSDSSKYLLPLYFDMPKEELPDDFAALPSYNIKEDGFEQELIRGIKKMIPLPVMLAEKRKKMRKHLGIAVGVLAILGIISIIISIPWFNKNAEYKDAMSLYDNGNYPQALWSFEKLDNFRKSQSMVEECESAWRKSVSTIATDNELSSSSYGSYYVSANGTVETFSYNSGTLNENIQIDEHGKIISVGDNYELLALHEDGHLDNFTSFEEYDNIIKISPIFNATPVALLSNGTLIYSENLYMQQDIVDDWFGDLDKNNNDYNDEWLMEISTWENIVDFDIYISRYGFGACQDAVFVGIHADGTVSSVSMSDDDDINIGSHQKELDGIKKFNEFLGTLKNAKSIAVYVDPIDDSIYNAGVLTTDNKLITYVGGVQQTYDIESAIDIEIDYEYDTSDTPHITNIYVLYESGELSILNGKTVMEDVVYIENGFAVTRSGSIYKNFTDTESNPQSTEGKTKVFDEWTLKNLVDTSYKVSDSKGESSENATNSNVDDDINAESPSNLSEHYSNADGISFKYPSNYTIDGNYESDGFVSIKAENGNSIFASSPSITENSLIDMVKGEQTLQLPNGDMFRTVKVAEEAIVLESGETGYYFECVDIDGVYQIFFMAKKNGMLYSFIYNIKDEDAYTSSIDEAKAIINTFKIEN